MPTSFDELVEQLLHHVASSGLQGTDSEELERAIKAFYNSEQSSQSSTTNNVEADLLFSNEPPKTATVVDGALINAAWTWLVNHPDVTVRTVRRDTSSTSSPDATPTRTTKRLFTSTERAWQAIAGHGVDLKRVPRLEFELLSIIAAHGPNGIIQPELTKLAGQDKRSVPKRTDALASKGYIIKEKVIAGTMNTSLLKLWKYAGQEAQETSSSSLDAKTMRYGINFYDTWFHTAVRIIQDNGGVVALEDLRIGMGVTQEYKGRKAFARCVQRAVASGLWRKIRARVENPDSQEPEDTWIRAVQMLREPTENDTLAWRGFDAGQSNRANSIASGTPNLENQRQHDVDIAGQSSITMNIDDGNHVNLDEDDNDEDVHGLAFSRSVPQWTPDIPLSNIVFELVDSAGIDGISSMELNARTTGPFWHRTFDDTLQKLTNMWQTSQPPHLRHLTIVRDTGVQGKHTHYKFYTLPNFEKAVEAGKADWNAVMDGQKGLGNGKGALKLPGHGKQDLNQWGFPNPDARLFVQHSSLANTSGPDTGTELEPQVLSDTTNQDHPQSPSKINAKSSPVGLKRKAPTEIRNTPLKKAKTSTIALGASPARGIRKSSRPTMLSEKARSTLDFATRVNPGVYIDPDDAKEQRFAHNPPHRGRPRKNLIVVVKSAKLLELDWFGDQQLLGLVEAVDDHTQQDGQTVDNDKASLPQSAQLDHQTADLPQSHIRPPAANQQTTSPAVLDVLPKRKRGRPSKADLAQRATFVDQATPGNVNQPSLERIVADKSSRVSEPHRDDGISVNPEYGASSVPTTAIAREPPKTPVEDPRGQGDPFNPSHSTELAKRARNDFVGLLRAVGRDSPAEAVNGPVERQNGTLPDLVHVGADKTPKVFQRTTPKKQGLTRKAGSVRAERIQIVMDTVRRAGGVWPGTQAMWYPFRTEWEKRYNQLADRVTIKNLVDDLVRTGELKKYTFRFVDRAGKEQHQEILTLPDIASSSVQVKTVQEAMIALHPQKYFPQGIEIKQGSLESPSSTPVGSGKKSRNERRDPKLDDLIGFETTPGQDPFNDAQEFPAQEEVTVRRTEQSVRLLDQLRRNRRRVGYFPAGYSFLQSMQSTVDHTAMLEYLIAPDQIFHGPSGTFSTSGMISKIVGPAETLQASWETHESSPRSLQDIRDRSRNTPNRRKNAYGIHEPFFDDVERVETWEKTMLANEVTMDPVASHCFINLGLNGQYNDLPAMPTEDSDWFPYTEPYTDSRKGSRLRKQTQLTGIAETPSPSPLRRVVLRSSSTSTLQAPLAESDPEATGSSTGSATAYLNAENQAPTAEPQPGIGPLQDNSLSGILGQLADAASTDPQAHGGVKCAACVRHKRYCYEATETQRCTFCRTTHSLCTLVTADRAKMEENATRKAMLDSMGESQKRQKRNAIAKASRDRIRRIAERGAESGPSVGSISHVRILPNSMITGPIASASNGQIVGSSSNSQLIASSPSLQPTVTSTTPAQASTSDNRCQHCIEVNKPCLGASATERCGTCKIRRHLCSKVDADRKKLLKWGRIPDESGQLETTAAPASANGKPQAWGTLFMPGMAATSLMPISIPGWFQGAAPLGNVQSNGDVLMSKKKIPEVQEIRETPTLGGPPSTRVNGISNGTLSSNGVAENGEHSRSKRQMPYMDQPRKKSRLEVPSTTEKASAAGPSTNSKAVHGPNGLAPTSTPMPAWRKAKALQEKQPAFHDSERLNIAVVLIDLLCAGGDGKSPMNWDLVAHALAFKYVASTLAERWRSQRKTSREDLEKLRKAIQKPFLAAFESDELPKIDFANPEMTDWPALVRWAEITVLPLLQERPDDHVNDRATKELLGDIGTLGRKFDVILQKPDAAHAHATLATPYDCHIMRAKSWARAVALTRDANYNVSAATQKMACLDTSTLNIALSQLQMAQTLVRRKAGRQLPGRNFLMPKQALASFMRWSADPSDSTFLRLVASARNRWVVYFCQNEYFQVPQELSAQDMLVLTEMLAQGFLKMCGAAQLPAQSGPQSGNLDFPTIYQRTAAFTPHHPLTSRVFIPNENPTVLPGAIPMWVDINGDLLDDVWDMILRSILHMLVFKPGSTAKTIELAHHGHIWAWEIELVLEWFRKVGIARPLSSVEAHRDGDGWMATEWWYCAFLPEIAMWKVPTGAPIGGE